VTVSRASGADQAAYFEDDARGALGGGEA